METKQKVKHTPLIVGAICDRCQHEFEYNVGDDSAVAELKEQHAKFLEALRTIIYRCVGTRYANKKGLACINAIAKEAISKVEVH